jgi:MYXO-CTERM domain-containing protein
MESGLVVAIETTLGELTAVFDEGDGTYTSQLTSEEPGEAIITAQVSGVALDVFERVTVLPVRLPNDAVRLQAGDLSGTLQSFEIPIYVFADLDRAIDDFNIHLAVHPDIEIDPVATRWSRGDASVTFDGAHSEWVVDLGDLDIVGGDDGAPQLTVSLRAPNGLPDDAQLVARAYQVFDPISEPITVPLVFQGVLPGPAPTADACSCQSTAPVAPSLLVVVVALGLAVVTRRRRLRGSP